MTIMEERVGIIRENLKKAYETKSADEKANAVRETIQETITDILDYIEFGKGEFK